MSAVAAKVAVLVVAAAALGLADRAMRPIPAKTQTVKFIPTHTPTPTSPTAPGPASTSADPAAPGGGDEPSVARSVTPNGTDAASGVGAQGSDVPSANAGAPTPTPTPTPGSAGATIPLRPIPPEEFNELVNLVGIVEVSVDQVKALLDNEYGQIIDGRQDHERVDGWVPGAVHLTRTMLATDEGLKLAERLAKENEGFPLIVYCGGPECEESHHLAQLLISRFPTVLVMKEGMGGWVARGLEVEK